MTRAAVFWGALVIAIAAGCVGTLTDEARFRAALARDAAVDATGSTCPDVEAAIFAGETCSSAGCHTAPNAAGSLDLKAPGVAGRLVGVPAVFGGGALVDSRNPEASVLYRRLIDDAAGPKMPPAKWTPLDDHSIACVLSWIRSKSVAPPVATLPPSPDAAPEVDAALPTTIRLAAGAMTPITDQVGYVWSADFGFIGGRTGSFPNTTVTGTSRPEVYRAERRGADASFRYEFSLAKGDYTVNLRFAESSFTLAGERVFHVDVAGTRVLTDFDIIATTGGQDRVVDRQFPVTLEADEPLVIDFLVGPADVPKISAIEILPE